jgi:hypothetical protein
MSSALSRREVLAGAAATLAAAVVPLLAPASVLVPTPIPSPPVLWPTDTREQRQAVIVREIIQHIAEVEGRAPHTITCADIHHRVRYFGMTYEGHCRRSGPMREDEAGAGGVGLRLGLLDPAPLEVSDHGVVHDI